ncbi:HD domain-containing protein [Oryzomonas sagensis]|uniref:HD domain-containing protein n=1 Tax=Oryzomonas sagensis TaxID=2603857 RepID=A0ABQ6TMQ1_9BACT|nr:HD domain-containing protein [Oryzomonas sagensis]KAB0669746.1 HD domain-containing protein [Oryzomonas sagensis]
MNTTIAFLKELFPPSCHGRILLVGGCVRDHLLGRASSDIDLAVSLDAPQLAACGFRKLEPRSIAPIWFRHDQTFGSIEITQLPDLDTALAEDLVRRDFTVNAMAMSLDGELIDPLGGRRDLEERRLTPCSPLTFSGDPLRIFRAFRFEADGWRMTPESEALVREQGWHRPLSLVPVERFSREMVKALEGVEPERFFNRMLQFDVGRGYLPELFAMPAIPAGPLQHHPEGDLYTHSIQVLQRVARDSDNPLARFCAFFHDIGKLATDPALYPRHHGHDDAGFDLARGLGERLRLSSDYRAALAWTSRLHGLLNKWGELRDSTVLKTAQQAVKARIGEILPLVSAADKPGGPFAWQEWERAVRIATMTTDTMGIDDARLKEMAPGKRPGFILQRRVEILRDERAGKPADHRPVH